MENQVLTDLVLIFSLFTIAKKKSARATKPITAKSNSSRDDSISGTKRSSLSNIVRIAINPNAADTKTNLFDFMFLYAINDNAKRIAAKMPDPNSNISAISPLSNRSLWFCLSSGWPAAIDGFHNTLNNVKATTSSKIEFIWYLLFF